MKKMNAINNNNKNIKYLLKTIMKDITIKNKNNL